MTGNEVIILPNALFSVPNTGYSWAIVTPHPATSAATADNPPVISKMEILNPSIRACIRFIASAVVFVRILACSMATFVPVTLSVISRTASAFLIKNWEAAKFSAPNSLAK